MREFHRGITLALFAAGAMALAPAASHALTPEQQCQKAIASAGARFLKRSTAILTSCQRAIARGALPAGTDCLTDAATSNRRAGAAAKLARKIGAKCTDATAGSLALGGDCAGARTVAAIVGCISGSHAAAAVETVGGAAAPGALSAAAARCQTQASRQAGTFSRARLRALQRCKQNPPADLLPGTDCSADPRTAARIADRRAVAAGKIAAACDATALAEAHFAPPCALPATGESLAQCLLAGAEHAGDDAVAAEFRDTGFCGDAANAVEQRIDALLAQMTLAEKLQQMHGNGTISGGWRTLGVERLGIPGLGMIDGPRGVGAYGGNATCFPVGWRAARRGTPPWRSAWARPSAGRPEPRAPA